MFIEIESPVLGGAVYILHALLGGILNGQPKIEILSSLYVVCKQSCFAKIDQKCH